MIDVTAATAGKVLAGLYRALGMSQREFARQFAEATGKSFDGTKGQVWTWESGTRQPDLRSLESALAVLGFKLAIVPADDPNESPDNRSYGVDEHFNCAHDPKANYLGPLDTVVCTGNTQKSHYGASDLCRAGALHGPHPHYGELCIDCPECVPAHNADDGATEIPPCTCGEPSGLSGCEQHMPVGLTQHHGRRR